jgi:hypothetical protein
MIGLSSTIVCETGSKVCSGPHRGPSQACPSEARMGSILPGTAILICFFFFHKFLFYVIFLAHPVSGSEAKVGVSSASGTAV